MTDLENKYKSLLEKIEGLKGKIKKVTDDIANIKKDNYIVHCGKIIPYKDIDPLSVEEKHISTYDSYEYEFYIPCLKAHGLNYYDIRIKLKNYNG